MNRSRLAIVLAGLFLVGILAGCSTAPPGPRVPVVAKDPLPVAGETMAPLTFPGIDIDIEPGTLLGYNYEGAGMAKSYDYRWGPNFTEQTATMNADVQDILEGAGYRTVPWRSGGVTATPEGESVLELRSFVRLMEFNSFSASGGYFQAYCEVDWELHRPGGHEPVFKTRTTGYWKEEEHTAGVFLNAFNGALANLLAQDEFVAAVAVR